MSLRYRRGVEAESLWFHENHSERKEKAKLLATLPENIIVYQRMMNA